MSPAAARTSRRQIVAVAREVLEEQGLDGLSMQLVAQRVGVRAPSLYKHVQDRAELVRAVVEDALRELGSAMHAAAESASPGVEVEALANAYRAFAHRYPVAHGLIFANLPADMRPDPELNARAAEPTVRAAARLVGETQALEAARTLTAYAHGFVTMELAGAFRLGGDLDAAFRYGVRALASCLPRGEGTSDEAG